MQEMRFIAFEAQHPIEEVESRTVSAFAGVSSRLGIRRRQKSRLDAAALASAQGEQGWCGTRSR